MDYHWSFFWGHWESAKHWHFVETDRFWHKRQLIRWFSRTCLTDRLNVVLFYIEACFLRLIMGGAWVKKGLISRRNEFYVIVILLCIRNFRILLKWIFLAVVILVNVPRLWLEFGRGIDWVDRLFLLMGFKILNSRIYLKLVINLRFGMILIVL